jgi:transcriptional regulator GlxA family with amidase domain
MHNAREVADADPKHPPTHVEDKLQSSQAMGVFAERHYTVAEIAALWNLSKDTVRRMFQNEPGVLVLGGHSSGRKRRYATLRIPHFVLERVHHKYEVSY